MPSYREFHRRSIADREGFWSDEAKLIHWQKPFAKVLDYSRPPFAKWFVGGETNLCHNAVDRHLAKRADQNALVWISTEVDRTETYTYRELHARVNQTASMMQSLGAGGDFGPMPAYRKLATRAHPLLFSLVARRRVTDSTNGFRALRTSVLADPRLRLDQEWLDGYELEPYLYLQVIRLGYATTEVAVTKRYPPRELGQTKMKPVVDWWNILRPLVLVGLGIRK